MKYKNFTLEHIIAILDRLGGEEGAMRFYHGELAVVERDPLVLRTWKEILIGKLSEQVLTNQLKDSGIYISPEAADLLARIPYQKKQSTVDIVIPTRAQLGVMPGGTSEEVYRAIEHHGLSLCPPELGACFWPSCFSMVTFDARFVIAMEPITDARRKKRVFAALKKFGAYQLSSVLFDSTHFAAGEDTYIVCVKQRQKNA